MDLQPGLSLILRGGLSIVAHRGAWPIAAMEVEPLTKVLAVHLPIYIAVPTCLRRREGGNEIAIDEGMAM